MKHSPVSIFSTGYFSNLMEDYVAEKASLQELYGRPHNRDSYRSQMEERAKFQVDRLTLVSTLEAQYRSMDIENRYPSVYEHIQLLKNQSTYTVVTGHQLCLFTGPLYFIYKIVNTIRLAEELSCEKNVKVVPVFWMATEDHDFEEVNHIFHSGKRITWNAVSGNGVGRILTNGIEEAINELESLVNKSQPVSKFIDTLRRCYRPGITLSQATRELTTELFADKGLIVLDADEPALKKSVINLFSEELKHSVVEDKLKRAGEVLAHEHFNQVTPRDINLFYFSEGVRLRLQREGSRIRAVGTSLSWDVEDLIADLKSNPEKFSPNVILRPLYQETILPNLAYIGGGGELAYWLQLKELFDHFSIPFPILRLRNSVGFIQRKISYKMEKLGLTLEDIVKPVFAQKREYFKKELNLAANFENIDNKAEEIKLLMEEMANQVDRSIVDSAGAVYAKQKRLIANFEKKLLRSKQRKESDTSRMFDEIQNEILPMGSLQERKENYITILERYGDEVLDLLYDELDPFAHEFSWFVE